MKSKTKRRKFFLPFVVFWTMLHFTHSSELQQNSVKLRKCCQPNYILRDNREHGVSCIKSEIQPKAVPIEEYEIQTNSSQIVYEIVYNKTNMPKCSGISIKLLDNREGVWYRFSAKFPENTPEIKVGLDYFLWAAWIPINSSSYCVDMDNASWRSCLESQNKNAPDVFKINSQICGEQPLLLFCQLDENVLNEFTIHRYIFGLSSISTCFPILATLFLFFYLKIHSNIRKWVLISYFTSYCAACGLHGAQILIYINNLDQQANLWCKLFNHGFIYLGCVFGTACMFVSLDIFWCFWKMNSQIGIPNTSKRKVVMMLLATWVAPLILYVGGEIWREYFAMRPQDLAWKKCMSLNFDAIEFILMIQFVFKFGVYLSTSILINKHKRSTSFATPGAQNDFNESKTLYAKLFVTTGMPFTCLALDYCFADKDPMSWWWFILRFPHSAIGLYIFVVFGLSREVRKKWRDKRAKSHDKDLKRLKLSNISDESYQSQSSSNSNYKKGARSRNPSIWTFISKTKDCSENE